MTTRDDVVAWGENIAAAMPEFGDAADRLFGLINGVADVELRNEIKMAVVDVLAAQGGVIGDLTRAVVCPTCAENITKAITAAMGVSNGEVPS
jgi:hypothetical protein